MDSGITALLSGHERNFVPGTSEQTDAGLWTASVCFHFYQG
jgi:hypothetical protein